MTFHVDVQTCFTGKTCVTQVAAPIGTAVRRVLVDAKASQRIKLLGAIRKCAVDACVEIVAKPAVFLQLVLGGECHVLAALEGAPKNTRNCSLVHFQVQF